MKRRGNSLRVLRVWVITLGLVLAGVLGVLAILGTGGNPTFVAVGAVALGYLAVQSWRSGARFEADAHEGRPLSGRDPPEIRRALLDVCQESGRELPSVVIVRMDVPGVMVGYGDGRSLLAVDPRLLSIVGPDGLRALFAHELGHLGTDIHTDALRQYLPQTVGFATFWLVLLTGRGPTVVTAASAVYLVLAPIDGDYVLAVRGLLSLGVEPLALGASRYANRQEEYLADAFAADVVSPDLLADTLYRIAAVATGDNDEDVTGPVPWDNDRSLLFSLFATHPSIESRVHALGCEIPEWVRPYRPHGHHSQGERNADS